MLRKPNTYHFNQCSWIWILCHFHTCSKLIDFFHTCEISWEYMQKAYSDSICPVRVQQKTNTELLSLLVPGTVLQPALFLTLLQTMTFLERRKTNLSYFFCLLKTPGLFIICTVCRTQLKQILLCTTQQGNARQKGEPRVEGVCVSVLGREWLMLCELRLTWG